MREFLSESQTPELIYKKEKGQLTNAVAIRHSEINSVTFVTEFQQPL